MRIYRIEACRNILILLEIVSLRSGIGSNGSDNDILNIVINWQINSGLLKFDFLLRIAGVNTLLAMLIGGLIESVGVILVLDVVVIVDNFLIGLSIVALWVCIGDLVLDHLVDLVWIVVNVALVVRGYYSIILVIHSCFFWMSPIFSGFYLCGLAFAHQRLVYFYQLVYKIV